MRREPKEVRKIFPTDYEYSNERGERAGHPIYYSKASGVNAWISDLGNRLEVNQMDNKKREDAAVKAMEATATEGGEIKCMVLTAEHNTKVVWSLKIWVKKTAVCLEKYTLPNKPLFLPTPL